MLPAFGLTLLQNKAVTGNWITLPYMVSRYQYGIPATFAFEPNPTPHRPLTPEQDLDYRAQCAIHGDQPETLRSYFERLLYAPVTTASTSCRHSISRCLPFCSPSAAAIISGY